jgi:hypothetical protein
MLDDIDLAEEVKARLSQDHRIVAVDIEDLA